jgi:hypothetical protein
MALILLEIALWRTCASQRDSVFDAFGPLYIDAVPSDLFLSTLVACGVALVYGGALVRRRNEMGWLPLALSVLVGLLSLPVFFASAVAVYSPVAEYKTNDGREYDLLENSFLQGYSICIAEKTRGSLLGDSYNVVAVGPGSAFSSHLDLSKALSSEESSFVRTTDGVLIGVTGGHTAYVAYDPTKRIAYGQADLNGLGNKESSILKLEKKQLLGSGITLLRKGAS